jgi:hypothetical protein
MCEYIQAKMASIKTEKKLKNTLYKHNRKNYFEAHIIWTFIKSLLINTFHSLQQSLAIPVAGYLGWDFSDSPGKYWNKTSYQAKMASFCICIPPHTHIYQFVHFALKM